MSPPLATVLLSKQIQAQIVFKVSPLNLRLNHPVSTWETGDRSWFLLNIL